MSVSSDEAKRKLLAVGGQVSDLLLETAPELVVRIADAAKKAGQRAAQKVKEK